MSRPLSTSKNVTFYIVIFFFAFYILILLPSEASAGFIVQRPLYIGLTSGLVGYWSFDGQDVAGVTAYDRSGQNNNGTLTNGPTRAIGRIGQALEFDGVDDFVDVPNSASLGITKDITIAAWLKRNALNDYGGILAKTDGAFSPLINYDFVIGSAGCDLDGNSLCFFAQGLTPTIYIGSDIIDTNWHHVAVVRSGLSILFYVDGINTVTSAITSGDFGNDAFPVNIGRDGSSSSSNFSGSLDEVRLYNRALNQDEIKRLYKIGATTKINVPRKDTLQNGLVGYWSFDGQDMNATQARDASGNANHGTLTNGPTRAIGRIGQALEFDGVNDFVSVPNNSKLNLLTTVSVSLWVKYTTTANAVVLEKSSDNSHYYFQSGLSAGNMGFGIGSFAGDGSVDSTIAFNNNQWHHFVGTFDTNANMLQLFVDGVLNNTNSTTVEPTSNTQSLLIGSRSGSAAFSGTIDEVRIYNRVLNQDEIKRLYKIGATTKINVPRKDTLQNGLVGYWSFDGPDVADYLGTTTTAFDRSGRENHGTLRNNPKTVIGKIGQALEFDGNRSGVVVDMGVNSALNLSTQTNAAWIKLATSSPDNIEKNIYTYANFGGGGSFFSTIGDEVRWLWGGGCCFHDTSNVDLKAGVWYHVAVTYTDTTSTGNVKIYVDGVLRKTGDEITNPISATNATPAIGCRESSSTFITCLGGLIDDVRIYNRALSTDEIKRLYKMGL